MGFALAIWYHSRDTEARIAASSNARDKIPCLGALGCAPVARHLGARLLADVGCSEFSAPLRHRCDLDLHRPLVQQRPLDFKPGCCIDSPGCGMGDRSGIETFSPASPSSGDRESLRSSFRAMDTAPFGIPLGDAAAAALGDISHRLRPSRLGVAIGDRTPGVRRRPIHVSGRRYQLRLHRPIFSQADWACAGAPYIELAVYGCRRVLAYTRSTQIRLSPEAVMGYQSPEWGAAGTLSRTMGGAGCVIARCGGFAGSRMWNDVPTPASLSTQMRPP